MRRTVRIMRRTVQIMRRTVRIMRRTVRGVRRTVPTPAPSQSIAPTSGTQARGSGARHGKAPAPSSSADRHMLHCVASASRRGCNAVATRCNRVPISRYSTDCGIGTAGSDCRARTGAARLVEIMHEDERRERRVDQPVDPPVEGRHAAGARPSTRHSARYTWHCGVRTRHLTLQRAKVHWHAAA